MTCERQGKWIGGCKFEARYDVLPADLSIFDQLNATNSMMNIMLDGLKTRTYVHDICTTCGKIVKRDGNS